MEGIRDERRSSPRLPLNVPVTVAPLDPKGELDGGAESTLTRNVSAGGLYFATIRGAAFRLGMRVMVRISMPHRSIPGHDRVSFDLVGEGTVVRIDSGGIGAQGSGAAERSLSGVAIRFDGALAFQRLQLV
ncbi:MAG: PilZ domain-containing protein [Acidobacteria bacterium]|nr:PilZ domain-containing protein [Acidobacteriota bacterium]